MGALATTEEIIRDIPMNDIYAFVRDSEGLSDRTFHIEQIYLKVEDLGILSPDVQQVICIDYVVDSPFRVLRVCRKVVRLLLQWLNERDVLDEIAQHALAALRT